MEGAAVVVGAADGSAGPADRGQTAVAAAVLLYTKQWIMRNKREICI